MVIFKEHLHISRYRSRRYIVSNHQLQKDFSDSIIAKSERAFVLSVAIGIQTNVAKTEAAVNSMPLWILRLRRGNASIWELAEKRGEIINAFIHRASDESMKRNKE